ncbi:MAG: hypothetical protein BGP01_02915 [Paludibacter sp. 47-17]|nr:MAG: hypothetical protein BGP01_02915 [Paludibacter sp. 47-17]
MRKRMYFGLLLWLVIAAGLQAQQLTLRLNRVTVREAMEEVKKQSGYNFIYASSDVDTRQLITLDVVNQPLELVVKQLFAQQALQYEIKDRSIVLKKVVKPTALRQQQLALSGRVTDEKGEPVIGASVVIRDSGLGTITDIDGNFKLSGTVDVARPDLVVSYIGYVTQQLPVRNQSVFEIKLAEDTKLLTEVVVTAMGIERKSKSLTYATQTLGGQELTRAKDANFINSLQGKMSGLIITPNAGGAGSASKILLRGNSSIEGNNSPLIVIDGIPVNNRVNGQFDAKSGGYNMAYAAAAEGSDPLSTINPDDILNVTVLKGANAAALYGSDAANGVIIVTTRQGSEGGVKVSVSSSSMFERPLILPDLQNTFGGEFFNGQLGGRSWGKRISEQTAAENSIAGVSATPGNPVDRFFNTGTNFNNTVSISGGSERVQSYFSVGNTTAGGMVPNNSFSRTSILLRQTYSFLKNKQLKLDFTVNYIRQRTGNRTSGGTVYNPLYNLYLAPRNIDMEYYRTTFEKEGSWFANPIKIVPVYTGGIGRTEYWKEDFVLKGMQQHWFQGRGVPAANNPYWLTNRIQSEELLDRMYGTLHASYRISPVFDASYRINYSQNVTSGDSKTYATLVDPTGQYIDRGTYGWTDARRTDLFTDFLLNYKNEISEEVSASATVGGSLNKTKGYNFWMRNFGASGSAYYTSEEQLPTTINVFYPNASYYTQRQYGLSSDWARAVFATGQLGYNEKAYLDFSYRIDWSRAFTQFKTKGVRDYYGYYSVGANALLNELIRLPEMFNLVKIRGSYSEVGNSIPNKLYNEQPYDPATGRIQPATYTGFDHPLPETVRSVEGGFDLAMFDNSLTMDLTVYSSVMFNQYLPITSSIGSIKPINTGKVRNQGVEATVSYIFAPSHNFSWKTGVNFSYNDNKILRTYQNRKDIYIGIGMSDNLRVKFLEGGSYGDMYAKDFTRLKIYDVEKMRAAGNTTAEVGDIKLSPDGTPSMDAKGGHSVYLGNMNARVNLGWNNTLTWKGLGLYFLIDGKIGGKVVSFTEAYLDAYGVSQRTADARLSRLTTTVAGETVPAVVMPDGKKAGAMQYYTTIGDQIFPTEYVYDATNFRMRELSVSYTFRNLLGAGRDLSTSVVGRNLFFLYRQSPVDPDVSLSTQNALGGVDIFGLPSARSLGVNLKVTF